jgi:hypothetical protein
MFGFRSRVLESLEYIECEFVGLRIKAERTERYLRIIMSNQEVFDSYAAQIAEQNRQIRAAVESIVGEISSLQAAAQSATETPLDTSVMDAALEQLTSAVDQVESIPAPQVVEEPVAPVEPVVEAPVEVPSSEQPVEPVVEPSVTEDAPTEV